MYKPLLIVIIEPWSCGDRATSIIKSLGFSFHIREEATGFSGGIWVLWSNPILQISLGSSFI